jgi:hypothetical protein
MRRLKTEQAGGTGWRYGPDTSGAFPKGNAARHLRRGSQPRLRATRGSTWGVLWRPRQELADRRAQMLPGKRGPGPKKAAKQSAGRRAFPIARECGTPRCAGWLRQPPRELRKLPRFSALRSPPSPCGPWRVTADRNTTNNSGAIAPRERERLRFFHAWWPTPNAGKFHPVVDHQGEASCNFG